MPHSNYVKSESFLMKCSNHRKCEIFSIIERKFQKVDSGISPQINLLKTFSCLNYRHLCGLYVTVTAPPNCDEFFHAKRFLKSLGERETPISFRVTGSKSPIDMKIFLEVFGICFTRAKKVSAAPHPKPTFSTAEISDPTKNLKILKFYPKWPKISSAPFGSQ